MKQQFSNSEQPSTHLKVAIIELLTNKRKELSNEKNRGNIQSNTKYG